MGRHLNLFDVSNAAATTETRIAAQLRGSAIMLIGEAWSVIGFPVEYFPVEARMQP